MNHFENFGKDFTVSSSVNVFEDSSVDGNVDVESSKR